MGQAQSLARALTSLVKSYRRLQSKTKVEVSHSGGVIRTEAARTRHPSIRLLALELNGRFHSNPPKLQNRNAVNLVGA